MKDKDKDKDKEIEKSHTTLALREIDVKDVGKFEGIGINDRVKITAYGRIRNIGKDEWNEQKTLACVIDLDDVDVEKAGKQDDAIEKMKKAENIDELEKAKKEADDGEQDEQDEQDDD